MMYFVLEVGQNLVRSESDVARRHAACIVLAARSSKVGIKITNSIRLPRMVRYETGTEYRVLGSVSKFQTPFKQCSNDR